MAAQTFINRAIGGKQHTGTIYDEYANMTVGEARRLLEISSGESISTEEALWYSIDHSEFTGKYGTIPTVDPEEEAAKKAFYDDAAIF